MFDQICIDHFLFITVLKVVIHPFWKPYGHTWMCEHGWAWAIATIEWNKPTGDGVLWITSYFKWDIWKGASFNGSYHSLPTERSLVSKWDGVSKNRLTSNSPRLLVCGSPGTLSARFLPKSELPFRSLQYTYCLDASPWLPHQIPAPALEPTCPFPLAEPSV